MRWFPSTRLGARSARGVVLKQLAEWGFPGGTNLSEAAGIVVAELAANAATHGRVAGRHFEVRLTLSASMLVIEVADTMGEARPPEPGSVPEPDLDAESGRGMLLVEAVADRWAVLDRCPGKTVRVELGLRGSDDDGRAADDQPSDAAAARSSSSAASACGASPSVSSRSLSDHRA
ncbi:ATP-binding protein [Actinacidiphila yeochonensis]|uniref:ATP-binding protein n=1 Tax=Actinacidiphila yeochonensis TaxID=89050 RepID=UPI0007C7492E|nr:ATP-binding protein [Actinacidiphila yeochonensis]